MSLFLNNKSGPFCKVLLPKNKLFNYSMRVIRKVKSELNAVKTIKTICVRDSSMTCTSNHENCIVILLQCVVYIVNLICIKQFKPTIVRNDLRFVLRQQEMFQQ